MEAIKLTNNRTIADNLVERKTGTLYDTYYKALENLAKVYVDGIVENVLNNSFIFTSDSAGLKRWQAYYEQKPFDMTWTQFRSLLFLLNEATREGPTVTNIQNILKFFDATATFSQVTTRHIFYGTPGYVIATLTKGDDLITTDFDWLAVPNYNLLSNSHIWYTSGGVNTRFNEGTDYSLVLQEDGGKVQAVVTWITGTPPTDGESYDLLFKDDSIDHDDPQSLFYNHNSGTFPEEEAYIYTEDSSLPKVNEFFVTTDSTVIYESSALVIPKVSFRYMLQALLNKILPANIVFLLRFMDAASILYRKDQGPDPVTQPRQLIIYEPAYGQIRSYNLMVAGYETAQLRDAMRVDENDFLLILQPPPPSRKQHIVRYDTATKITTEAVTNVFSVDQAGTAFTRVDLNTLIFPSIGSFDPYFSVYDVKTGGSTTYYNAYGATALSNPAVATSPVFTTGFDFLWDMKADNNGHAYFIVRNIQTNDWYIRVLHVITNTLVYEVNLGPLAGQPNSFSPLSTSKYVFFHNKTINGSGDVVFVDATIPSVVSTTFDIINASVIAINDELVVSTKNDGPDVEIYTSAFGEVPTLLMIVPNMPASSVYLHENDLVLVNNYKSVAIVLNFVTLLGAAPVLSYHVDSNSQFLYPVDVY